MKTLYCYLTFKITFGINTSLVLWSPRSHNFFKTDSGSIYYFSYTAGVKILICVQVFIMLTSNEIRDSDQHDLQLNQDLYITIAYN